MSSLSKKLHQFKAYSKSYNYKILKKSLENALNVSEVDLSLNKSRIAVQSDSGKRSENDPCHSECFSKLEAIENSVHDESIEQIESPFEFSETEEYTNILHDSDNHNDGDSSETINNMSRMNSDSKSFLRNWALKNNITLSSLSELLNWLSTKPDLSDIPKDARTLLNTPRTTDVQNMGSGQFYYFGLRKKLTIVVKHKRVSLLELDFNVDGLPLYKSSNLQFWPILCRINKLPESVFAVAIFCGKSKPPLNDFFAEFVNELQNLTESGLNVDNKIITVNVRSFCCDTPARAFVKNIKNHNGYSGCDKCKVQGSYINRRMVFRDLDAAKRTDSDFLEQSDEEHHKGLSPLITTRVGLVTNFPVDVMHCVMLGTMRKLLFQWRDGSRLYRINKDDFAVIDTKIASLKKYWPVEFNRKPRSLAELERWKATEFMHFLLYSGIILLKHCLSSRVYNNFLVLKFAITILLGEDLNYNYNAYAGELLRHFITNACKIYGDEFLVYNTHAMIHLPDDAKKYGSLNSISCFPFENFLGSLKRMLRKSNMPLQQVVRRLAEHQNRDSPVVMNTEGLFGEVQFIDEQFSHICEGVFYKKYVTKHFTLTNKIGDNCISTGSGDIVQISYFVKKQNGKIYIIAKKLQSVKAFTDYPTDSSLLSLYECSHSDDIICFPVDDILHKGVLLPFENKFVFSPLIHLL